MNDAELGFPDADRDIEDLSLEANADDDISDNPPLVVNVNEAEHGFPGASGSMDCTHVHWNS